MKSFLQIFLKIDLELHNTFHCRKHFATTNIKKLKSLVSILQKFTHKTNELRIFGCEENGGGEGVCLGVFFLLLFDCNFGGENRDLL